MADPTFQISHYKIVKLFYSLSVYSLENYLYKDDKIKEKK